MDHKESVCMCVCRGGGLCVIGEVVCYLLVMRAFNSEKCNGKWNVIYMA